MIWHLLINIMIVVGVGAVGSVGIIVGILILAGLTRKEDDLWTKTSWTIVILGFSTWVCYVKGWLL